MSAIKSFTVKQINKIQGKHRHLSRESREGINKKINKYINNNFEVVKNDFEVEHSHTG